MDLEMLVIGSGPGGQKAAIQAAKLGKRVAVVERRERVGGISIHSGTIPSKTLREAIFLELSRRATDHPDPLHPEHSESEAVDLLLDRTARVIGNETSLVREQFRRNNVGILYGEARFVDEHTVAVDEVRGQRSYTAENIVIAVGSKPARPKGVDFDDRTVVDSDSVLRLDQRVPGSMTLVGAGVVGMEYASMFAALGTRVTVVDARPRLLPFLDGEIAEAFQFLLRRRRVTFRFREEVVKVERREGGAVTYLKSGKEIPSETVLYAIGRQGAVDGLGLDKIGVEANRRGQIEVDPAYRTTVKHIYAVGDVVGAPALAATSFEQGRIAALHAFGESSQLMPDYVPTGVYSIPEMGTVGRTEEDLTEAAVPYVVGIARYNELARGIMTGDEDGLLKLLVSVEDGALLGVHVLGTSAADLVHIGQGLLGREGAVDFLVSAVFNYPTFAEAYKVAALDAANRIRMLVA